MSLFIYCAISTIAGLLNEKETGEIEEYREPYSCDERRELTIILSGGGPSDGYKIYFDRNNQVTHGYYFFADWFEYQEFKLTGDELDRVISVYPFSPGQ